MKMDGLLEAKDGDMTGARRSRNNVFYVHTPLHFLHAHLLD